MSTPGTPGNLTFRAGFENQDQVFEVLRRMTEAVEKLHAPSKQSAEDSKAAGAARKVEVEAAGGLTGTLGQLRDEMRKHVDMYARMRESGTSFVLLGRNLAGAMGSILASANPLTVALGATAAVTGAYAGILSHAASKVHDMWAELKSLAAISGMALGEVETLRTALDLAGVSGGSLTMAFFRLGMELETGGKHLAQLGISTRDVSGAEKDLGAVFLEVHDRLSSMEDASKRNALLMQTFGRAGREMAGIFSMSRDKLQEFIAKARQFTDFDNEKLVAGVKQYHEATVRLRESWEDLWVTMADPARMARWLTFLSDALGLAKKLAETWKEKVFGLGKPPETAASAGEVRLRKWEEELARHEKRFGPGVDDSFARTIRANIAIEKSLQYEARREDVEKAALAASAKLKTSQTYTEYDREIAKETAKFHEKMALQTLAAETSAVKEAADYASLSKSEGLRVELDASEKRIAIIRQSASAQKAAMLLGLPEAAAAEMAKQQTFVRLDQETQLRITTEHEKQAELRTQITRDEATAAVRTAEDIVKRVTDLNQVETAVAEEEHAKRLALIELTMVEGRDKTDALRRAAKDQTETELALAEKVYAQESFWYRALAANAGLSAEQRKKVEEQLEAARIKMLEARIKRDKATVDADKTRLVAEQREVAEAMDVSSRDTLRAIDEAMEHADQYAKDAIEKDAIIGALLAKRATTRATIDQKGYRDRETLATEELDKLRGRLEHENRLVMAAWGNREKIAQESETNLLNQQAQFSEEMADLDRNYFDAYMRLVSAASRYARNDLAVTIAEFRREWAKVTDTAAAAANLGRTVAQSTSSLGSDVIFGIVKGITDKEVKGSDEVGKAMRSFMDRALRGLTDYISSALFEVIGNAFRSLANALLGGIGDAIAAPLRAAMAAVIKNMMGGEVSPTGGIVGTVANALVGAVIPVPADNIPAPASGNSATTAPGAGGFNFGRAAKGGVFPGEWIPFRAFQAGGMVNQPTLGMVGEGGGPEAVIPLEGGAVPVKMVNGAPNITIVNIVQRKDQDLSQLMRGADGKRMIVNTINEDILARGDTYNMMRRVVATR